MPTYIRPMKFRPLFASPRYMTFYYDVPIPKSFHPEIDCYLVKALLFRQKIDMNTFVLIVGNPRSSKSFFAMKMCEMLAEARGRKFNVKEQLTFDDIKKFLLWSKNAHLSEFILDETGTSLSPEQFWEIQQRVMRRFVQTQGFRRNILFWVLPSIVFIQKGFRFLTNYAVKTLRQGKVRVYKMVVDQLLGKGFPYFVEQITFPPPSKETVDNYLAMKTEWNDASLEDDLVYLDEVGKEDEMKVLRRKSLELSVALKERRLNKLQHPDVILPPQKFKDDVPY